MSKIFISSYEGARHPSLSRCIEIQYSPNNLSEATPLATTNKKTFHNFELRKIERKKL
jgi:hypothetical protein